MKFFSATVLSALFFAGLSHATDLITPEKATDDIKARELQNVLWNLQKIARDNGGNRAHGTSGYKASVDFVVERVVKRFGARLDTYVQEFNYTYTGIRNFELTGPDGDKVDFYNHQQILSTPLPGGLTAPLLHMPVNGTRGTMCLPEHWDGIDVAGKILLFQYAVCNATYTHIRLAKQNGASAVVFYNNVPTTPRAQNPRGLDLALPSGVVPQAVGEDWIARLAAGEDLDVTLIIDAFSEQRKSWNVISETKLGNPDNVVMMGAHLDSVQAGPGINDDGSGSAALLEIATSFQKYTGFKNKVRFAWWGTEELGKIGSLYYVAQLSEAERDKIKFYFNYDMIASLYPDLVVYADNEAHQYGARHLLEYLESAGAAVRPAKFGTGSDYVSFLQVGIPSSGLFTGSQAQFDPCYHQRCDTLDNINWDVYEKTARSAAYAAAKLALNMEGVPPRNTSSLNLRSVRGIQESFHDWASGIEVVETHSGCGGGHAE
ncbi:aminopeptidase Y [Cordyceps fumosorosea ARSEF 2679]|uniref:Peptide hydrolase n=1 Tax=Cordyceps fumosorosea (strain ARSEF 2679) TaxID=1081104 RepID=A0A167N6I3_CORFA|nr:aminopeptidase Y [Cordyceps fumosorosea ARSEF 2679]OAA55188.1 aminopeptidase Y [Cordyceps fumosorosea ARSEF 2679]